MYKTILLDLDNTLLPMNEDKFVERYFKMLVEKMAPYGYDPNKLIETIWKGTYAMYKNDGKLSNEELFWYIANKDFPNKIINDKYLFDEFYETRFDDVKDSCGYESKAKVVVDKLKKDYKLILATNPIFPYAATSRRIKWAGLSIDDFEYISTYENSHYSKPNPEYYKEILTKYNLDPKECLMIGNDVLEDGIAKSLGIDVYLIKDNLINKKDLDISNYQIGNYDELIDYIDNLKR